MNWLKNLINLNWLVVRVDHLEREIDALKAIVSEQAEEAAYQTDNLRDKRRLLYQLRGNLTKLRFREAAYGWSLGLSNQMDDTQQQIELLETELEFYDHD